MTAIAVPAVTISFFTAQGAIAQSTRKAVVFDPPSNVRAYPNGQIICSVRSASSINVYGYNNGWYKTDYCGQGYIHQSQVQLQQQNQAKHSKSFCDVINISQGQLALRFTPNGESRAGLNNGNTVRPLQLTSFSDPSLVQMWDIQTGKVIRNLGGHSDVVTSIAISPDGQTLATGSKDGTIRIMDLNTRELIRVLKDAGQIRSVSFSPDSRTVASSSEDGKIMVWQKP